MLRCPEGLDAQRWGSSVRKGWPGFPQKVGRTVPEWVSPMSARCGELLPHRKSQGVECCCLTRSRKVWSAAASHEVARCGSAAAPHGLETGTQEVAPLQHETWRLFEKALRARDKKTLQTSTRVVCVLAMCPCELCGWCMGHDHPHVHSCCTRL